MPPSKAVRLPYHNTWAIQIDTKADKMDTDGIEKLIGRMYTAFVARDLTFFLSGGLVIAAVFGAPVFDSFTGAISLDKDRYWLAIPVYLAVSYTLGVLLQEITLLLSEHIPNWVKARKRKDYQLPDPLVVQMETLFQTCSPQTMLGLERILFLKQIGATQFPALIIVGVALWIRNPSPSTLGVLVPLAILAALCLWLFYRMSKQQERIIIGLQQATAQSSKDHT